MIFMVLIFCLLGILVQSKKWRQHPYWVQRIQQLEIPQIGKSFLSLDTFLNC